MSTPILTPILFWVLGAVVFVLATATDVFLPSVSRIDDFFWPRPAVEWHRASSAEAALALWEMGNLLI